MADTGAQSARPRRRWLRWPRWVVLGLGVIVLLLIAGRLAMGPAVVWYVNRTIDRDPLYDGRIDSIDIDLWRGAYFINDVRLDKVTGSQAAPLFRADRIDLSIQWEALLEGSIVGEVVMEHPQINFVHGSGEDDDQTGVGGPWLDMVADLFPFKINRVAIHDGEIHFRADRDPAPIDVYLNDVEAEVNDLTNVQDRVAPLITTVNATGKAMNQADFEFTMELDPFSYRPTFKMLMRLLALDVTQINDLARGYGHFDFEHGYFDLVVEADAKQGRIEGYVKPLFRDLQVLSLDTDLGEDNILELFWEALIGLTTQVLQNPPREQFGTLIHFTGDLTDPQTNILEIVANVLRNAFIRAYLPQPQSEQRQTELEFQTTGLHDAIWTDEPPNDNDDAP